MTELDWPPVAVDDMILERKPKACRHPKWLRAPSSIETVTFWVCGSCQKTLDPDRAKRGKNARAKGNSYERSVAKRLGIKRVGQYGGAEDAGDANDWISVQCKVGGTYPLTIDRWLRAIPDRADRLRAVVIGDAPGSSGKRRELIVLDFSDFVNWYGRASGE